MTWLFMRVWSANLPGGGVCDWRSLRDMLSRNGATAFLLIFRSIPKLLTLFPPLVTRGLHSSTVQLNLNRF